MNEKKASSANGFEKSLDRLEAIVAEMEAGNLSLDQMIANFEEGSKLVKQCSSKLTEVERKIEKLVSLQDADKTEPFEGGE
ncbi:MAG TPA: exodeoxyribonuclease VII small subunit [Kiritimatiellia bacterium]|nr:exodeoxyribonuclease VII small subunit [Kiritimatiellia bacterium]